jgi:HD-GYP domain-containing protein (c-di-GMP phosphodiesterase class II)
LSEIIRRLAAINQAARAMNAELDPDQLLDTILSQIEGVLQLEACALLLFDDEAGTLRIEAARGYRPEVVERFRARPGEGITGQVFISGEPLIVNDVTTWDGYVEGVRGARSEMAAPLRLDEEVIGVLDAESRRANAFVETDLDLFRIFANQAATAIRNARLVRKLERRSQALEKSVQELALLGRLGRQMSSNLALDSLLDEVLGLAHKALQFDHCAVLLKRPGRQGDAELVVGAALGYRDEVRAGMVIPPGQGITGRVLNTGQPILVPDVRINGRYIEGVAGGRCEMAAPLIARDEVLGVLDAESRRPHAFTEADLRLFATFAAWAAQALHNAEIYSNLDRKRAQLDRQVAEIDRMNRELREYAGRIERTNRDLQRRVRELETLQEASRTITASLDLDQTLESIIGMTREIVASSSCAIRLLDEEELCAAEAPAAGEPGEPEPDERPRTPAPPGSKTLAVPLTIGQRIIGYFELASPDQAAFDDGDQRVLQVLASQAAIAIENARLFAHTQQTYYETIRSLAQALEARDAYTKGHSERVTRYALRIAEQLGMEERRRKVLQYAGMLHDIGKIGISDSILHKELELTDEEWNTIRSHPLFGDTILEPIRFLADAQRIVLHHHERYDGSGYPDRLRADAIPLEARIIAVADAYDAMTSDRPYRQAMTHVAATAEIEAAAGRQFDPRVVDAFLATVGRTGPEPKAGPPQGRGAIESNG